jgi:hypothetical protein
MALNRREAIALEIAAKLDWLDHRSHRLGCADVNMQDPRDLAATIEQHTRVLTGSVWGRAAGLGTDPRATAVEVCARLLALVEALERVELDVTAGEAA